MNKKIPSSLALALIISFTLIVSVYSITQSRNMDYNADIAAIIKTKNVQKNPCQTHAYSGSASIKVWRMIRDGKPVLQVVEEDLVKLPTANMENFQLIDAPSELETKLSNSSKEHPVEIEVSGFATLCNGTNLASLEYKEGVFRPYIIN